MPGLAQFVARQMERLIQLSAGAPGFTKRGAARFGRPKGAAKR
jgi:hypothetical protein